MPRSSSTRLTRAFFNRPTLDVCRDILGKFIVFDTPKARLSGRIVEVEAYIGETDPACHAAPGPTKRNIYLYSKPGIAYIYLIYGFHFCYNFVTEREGFPAAVLLRAVEPVEGIDQMIHRTPTRLPIHKLASGPGRVCRAFGLSLKQNGWDIADRKSLLYVESRDNRQIRIGDSKRIGITKGTQHLWRFYDIDSPAVSGTRGKRISKR